MLGNSLQSEQAEGHGAQRGWYAQVHRGQKQPEMFATSCLILLELRGMWWGAAGVIWCGGWERGQRKKGAGHKGDGVGGANRG